jgi:hypothetical protein
MAQEVKLTTELADLGYEQIRAGLEQRVTSRDGVTYEYTHVTDYEQAQPAYTIVRDSLQALEARAYEGHLGGEELIAAYNPCQHIWEELPGEPPEDACTSCGIRRQ